MGLELALENDRIAKRTVMKADCCHRFLPAVSLCALLSGCAYPVKISYPSEASIHPAFNQPFTTWAGERVRVVLTPSLRAESLRYLANYDQVFLAIHFGNGD
jgi:hypothetical protein